MASGRALPGSDDHRVTTSSSLVDDNPKITMEELLRLKDECLTKIRAEELYQVRNDAKLRAVYTSQSYDEFKDIVDAAHLKPINKKDKVDASTKSRLWNTAAKECPKD